MRLLSLAVFAVLALVIGAYEEDGMTLMIGGASALAAVASLPSWKLSTFLTILADLFADRNGAVRDSRPRRPPRLLAARL